MAGLENLTTRSDNVNSTTAGPDTHRTIHVEGLEKLTT